MAVNAAQFVSITRHHIQQLNIMLEKNIDNPEAAGILASMIYLQQSINLVSPLLPPKKEEQSADQNSIDTA